MSKKIILLKIVIIILYSIYFTYFIVSSFSIIYSSTHTFKILDIVDMTYIFSIVKKYFIYIVFLFSLIFSNSMYSNIFNTLSTKNSKNISNENIRYFANENIYIKIGVEEYLTEFALYQNMIITGAIGSGKTSGIIYPLLSQFLIIPKLSGLILDVKGNMKEYIYKLNTIKTIYVIEIGGKYTYNPLDKPDMTAYLLAQRLVQVLELFSNARTSDTYWFDKSQQLLTECIKLVRLYNNNYVTFTEIYNLIFNNSFLLEKIEYVKERFLSANLSTNEQYDFNSVLSYFMNEYSSLDSKILSIIKSEISRIIIPFTNDIDVANTFCPPQYSTTFQGFKNIHDSNSIILLNMNIGKYQNLSRIVASYLKLDFQSEIFDDSTSSPVFFLCDEYQEYVTSNDPLFFSLSREFKVINIVSTQSYSSLLCSLKDEYLLNTLLQSFVNKLFLRTDDNYTIEYAQKLFGKEDKTKYSNTISENAQETNYNYLLNFMKSKKSNISQSYSSYINSDNVFDSKDFSLNLKSFEAIGYLSDGTQMQFPHKITLIPHFRKE